MPETATTWNEIEKFKIKQAKLVRPAAETRYESTCASCGGLIPVGGYELVVHGRPIHDHCAEDLGVEVR